MVHGHRSRNKKLLTPTNGQSKRSGRLRDLYKSFLKINILPSEVDKQEFDILIWIFLSNEKEKNIKQMSTSIMGLF